MMGGRRSVHDVVVIVVDCKHDAVNIIIIIVIIIIHQILLGDDEPIHDCRRPRCKMYEDCCCFRTKEDEPSPPPPLRRQGQQGRGEGRSISEGSNVDTPPGKGEEEEPL